MSAGSVTAALALTLLAASTATAGGPTSVLVVDPESTQSTALYFTDKDYDTLQHLLGEPGQGRRTEPSDAGIGIGSGRQVNVTWMIHDVQPWRIDRVFPDSTGSEDIWIHTTQRSDNLADGYWHKATDRQALRSLLKKLDVMGPLSARGMPPLYPAPWATSTPAATPSAARPQATAEADGGGTDWWWAIPGLAAGAAAVLLLRPFARRRPRQQLGDSQP